jgi:hypothetical protein
MSADMNLYAGDRNHSAADKRSTPADAGTRTQIGNCIPRINTDENGLHLSSNSSIPTELWNCYSKAHLLRSISLEAAGLISSR